MRFRPLLALVLFSCTFPSVTFDDASVPFDSGAEATVDDAGDAGDAGPIADGGADAPLDPCDEDNDGYKSVACEGGDCNDHDKRVNPGVTNFVTDVPDAFPWGDWNCDGNKEYEYTPAVTCAAGLACNTASGFATAEECGISGTYVTCTGLCSLTDGGKRTQGCR